jgi:hypothetical protein
MSWDASATLQLIAILGSVASVGMAWYQRRHITTASQWLRGTTNSLSKLGYEAVKANAAQAKLVIHVLVHPTLGISIRNSSSRISARGTIPTSKQAPQLQPGAKRQDMLSMDAAPSRHVAFVSWQIPWRIQWRKLAFSILVNSKPASSRRSKSEN